MLPTREAQVAFKGDDVATGRKMALIRKNPVTEPNADGRFMALVQKGGPGSGIKGHVRDTLDKLSAGAGPDEHFDAMTVHDQISPGSHSLSSTRAALNEISEEPGYSKTDTGAGRGRFVGYRKKSGVVQKKSLGHLFERAFGKKGDVTDAQLAATGGLLEPDQKSHPSFTDKLNTPSVLPVHKAAKTPGTEGGKVATTPGTNGEKVEVAKSKKSLGHLFERVFKGGPGSGVRGHTSGKSPSQIDADPEEVKAWWRKLQGHVSDTPNSSLSTADIRGLVQTRDSIPYWVQPGWVQKRNFTDKKRKELASSGAAMSDGSYPIEKPEDVSNAVSLVGASKNHSEAEVKAHIKSRAKAIGAEDKLPDSWSSDKKKEDVQSSAQGFNLQGQPIPQWLIVKGRKRKWDSGDDIEDEDDLQDAIDSVDDDDQDSKDYISQRADDLGLSDMVPW